MNPSLKKRFWESASVIELDEGFSVALDGRRLKTPAKADLVVPVRAIAQLIADEWGAQVEQVNPEVMPTTRWANAAIDKVSAQRNDVIAMLAEYGGSDLLCYRADHPEELFQQQKTAWDPVLDWAEKRLNAPLEKTRGISPITQPNQSLLQMKNALEALDSFELTAIHDMITITGSLVLALAVSDGALGALEAWDISRIDEVWQANLWGEDEEAVMSARSKSVSFIFSHRILQLLRV